MLAFDGKVAEQRVLDDLRRRILPPLVQTADTISSALTHQGPAYHRPVS